MASKGYSSVSQVEEDSDDNVKQSVTDLLKASANRRQRQSAANRARNNNLPDLEMEEEESDHSNNDNPNNENNRTNNQRSRYYQAEGDNIGNIPNTSQSVTNCMNKSWKICSLFGIEIHIHVLLPIFFVATFLIWLQLILKDTGNTVWYILLIVLFNISLWETVLIHELGHCLAGYLVGGSTDKVLLWPLGGLAFTQAPPQLNNADGDAQKRTHQIIISLGGPLTHIPHMVIYGLLLLWYCDDTDTYYASCPYGANPFKIWEFWQETIVALPGGQGLWFWYDFLMICFMLNFWLFVINVFIPAYPLDGSKIFMNYLLGRYDRTTSATIYCWVTGVIAVIAIVLGATWFRTQTMLFFTGVWAAFQVYQLSMLIQKSQEIQHPLLIHS
eukprot:177158_1